MKQNALLMLTEEVDKWRKCHQRDCESSEIFELLPNYRCKAFFKIFQNVLCIMLI